jgi:hypothetical protein
VRNFETSTFFQYLLSAIIETVLTRANINEDVYLLDLVISMILLDKDRLNILSIIYIITSHSPWFGRTLPPLQIHRTRFRIRPRRSILRSSPEERVR